MNYLSLTKIALGALQRNKTRTFLTMLGIIIGVASVIAMLAIGEGSKKSIQDQVSSMGSNLIMVMPSSMMRGGIMLGTTGAQNITLNDVKAIEENCPSISMVSPEVRSAGQSVFSNQNWPTTIFGANEKYLDIKKFSVAKGRMFNEREIKTAAKVCLVGQTVITKLFGENSDPIGNTIRFKNIPFKIIGTLTEKGENTFGQDQDDMIIAPYTTVQKRILAITYIQDINASAASEAKAPLAVNEIEQTLRTQHKLKATDDDDFQVRSQDELVKTFTTISNVLTILLGSIAGISLLVGGIGIMNIMYVSVTERTREIGLRLAVGGKGKDILMQFLVESIMISVFGGIIGILLGAGLSKIVATAMSWPVVVMPGAVLLAFLVCTVIGIFFGWYPARKAAGLDPIDALRYE
jgi:putative ABC transport system permease protein